MAEVLVKSLHKTFPDGTVAVEELDLRSATASCSSCSARRAAARRRRCAASRAWRRRPPAQITIGDEVVSGLRPSQRDIAMVFQFYALYPHLSVRDNMAFPLRAAKAAGVRDQRAGRRGGADAAARAVPDPQAEQALGRRAAARRARAARWCATRRRS